MPLLGVISFTALLALKHLRLNALALPTCHSSHAALTLGPFPPSLETSPLPIPGPLSKLFSQVPTFLCLSSLRTNVTSIGCFSWPVSQNPPLTYLPVKVTHGTDINDTLLTLPLCNVFSKRLTAVFLSLTKALVIINIFKVNKMYAYYRNIKKYHGFHKSDGKLPVFQRDWINCLIQNSVGLFVVVAFEMGPVYVHQPGLILMEILLLLPPKQWN